ncbi:MAG: hypothetical protein MZV64_12565 [Ignavibacteriales bacterium]|nr:hypothetical protein [Ignavibacteriales bacterium]
MLGDEIFHIGVYLKERKGVYPGETWNQLFFMGYRSYPDRLHAPLPRRRDHLDRLGQAAARCSGPRSTSPTSSATPCSGSSCR